MGMDSYDQLANAIVGLIEAKGPYAGIEKLEEERDAGNTDAIAILGEFYLEGIGVIADTQMGLQLLNQAADAGNAHANCTLGTTYFDGSFGVEQNESLGHMYIEKAAEGGIPFAMGLCASDYWHGIGVPIDKERGFEWATRGVKFGDFNSHVTCAVSCQTGEGAPLNIPLAVHHYREILNMRPDNGDAMCELAQCLADPFEEVGIVPTYEDISEAIDLLFRGVELGSVRAHYVLGVCYAKGVGVQLDYDLAHHYIEIAAQNGDESAQQDLPQFRKTMRGTWTI